MDQPPRPYPDLSNAAMSLGANCLDTFKPEKQDWQVAKLLIPSDIDPCSYAGSIARRQRHAHSSPNHFVIYRRAVPNACDLYFKVPSHSHSCTRFAYIQVINFKDPA